MLKGRTIVACQLILARYLEIIADNPGHVTPEFRAMIADSEADLRRFRNDEFMEIRRNVEAVPTADDPTSLLQLASRE